MMTVILREDIGNAIVEKAKDTATDVESLVNQLIERYLYEEQQKILEREIAAYEAMHTQLFEQYPNEWVAIHQQKLILHHGDVSTVRRQIRNQFGFNGNTGGIHAIFQEAATNWLYREPVLAASWKICFCLPPQFLLNLNLDVRQY